MGITGLLPFIEKASRRVNVSEFSGCTVAIDSYCWLHKGAFACADKLVRGEDTDIHIKYCLKYVTMLLSKNIKPILVFDGRHLPAKAMTESKRRESRDISKKRAAELLSLGKIEEARSYMRRSVDITHSMALSLIQECRLRNVDCIVAPYEADAQLAYLNIKKIAHLVITEDSDLILFGCTKVLFKMDLEGTGTLVETIKLPLVMKCPIEHYTFDKFRQMCIMSGCDYLASLPGIGLAKARQFVTATQDSNFANALKKLPSFFNRSSLTVTDEYREHFLKAEATFKHQYVYDPLERRMVRLTEPDDEDVELALCVNAGEILEPKIAFQLALGNLDPFTLKKMDDWHPDTDRIVKNGHIKTDRWKENGSSNHHSIWAADFIQHLENPCPWQKKVKKPEPIIAVPKTRARKKVVNLVSKYVPETQDESLSIQTLSAMYSVEPVSKKPKITCETVCTQDTHNVAMTDDEIIKEVTSSQKERSPVLENKERSFRKCMRNSSYSVLKSLSRFPRTVLDDNVVESKFFSNSTVTLNTNIIENDKSIDNIVVEDSPEKCNRNPFKVKTQEDCNKTLEIDTQCIVTENVESKDNTIIEDSLEKSNRNPFKVKKQEDCNKSLEIDTGIENSQKENSPLNSPIKRPISPILESSPKTRNPLRRLDDVSPMFEDMLSEESVIENTYPLETLVTPVDSQVSFGSQNTKSFWNSQSQPFLSQPNKHSNVSTNGFKKTSCRVPGLKRTTSLPSNQPTLLSKFGFQKKPVLKR